MDQEKAIKYEDLRHEHQMKELAYIRETERLKHEWDLERFRITNAERKKRIAAKANWNNRRGTDEIKA